jgi:hypothetical protein
MIVYITTNLINGKKYIGSDSNNNPNYLGSGVSFAKAVKKYGKQNFKKQILAEVDNYDLMRELEIYYIQYFNAHKSKLFYNRSDKGHGQGGGERHWNFGKSLPESTKSKKSESMTGKKMHSEEQKQKWSINKKGKPTGIDYNNKKMWSGKTLLQCDLEGNTLKEWTNKKIAAKELGFNYVSIGNVCNPDHKQQIYKGFIWRYKQ